MMVAAHKVPSLGFKGTAWFGGFKGGVTVANYVYQRPYNSKGHACDGLVLYLSYIDYFNVTKIIERIQHIQHGQRAML